LSLSWWNGQTLPARKVRLSPDDVGLLLGEGLFDTLRVDEGQARDVEAHLDRLLAGLHRMGINLQESREVLEQAVAEIASAAPRPVARLRITVTSLTRLITTIPYEPPGEDLYRHGVPVRLLPEYRIDSRGPLVGLKNLYYQPNQIAFQRAHDEGAWEALLLNEQGRLVEGTRSNLALVFEDRILTPPTSDGCLPGTVRRRLLERGAIEEAPLTVEDLATAREALLMNSLIGVLPVSRIDGREMPVGSTAERLRRLITFPAPSAAPLPPPA
jgi:branched-chain amino acid aminotransferase